MTHDEFWEKYNSFDWEPYQPLAVVFNNGTRTYIDKPEQFTLGGNELVITRGTNPRKPERYSYADVARLVPLLELPADPGGMSYAEFDARIRESLMAEPFVPFVIELKSGERLEFGERGGTVRAGRFVLIVGEPPRSFVWLDYDQIARITTKAPATAGRD